MIKNLLTIDEMANELKIGKTWLYSRTRETGPGSIPRLKIGKYLRFDPDMVMAWLVKKNKEDWCRTKSLGR